jgi:outer membrane lipoprotein-sorting protein
MLRITTLLAATAMTVLVAAGCTRDISAKDILGETQKHLATVRTIQLWEERVTRVALDGNPSGRTSTKQVEFRFKRPDMFVQRDSEGETWTDATNVVQYVPSLRRYSKDRLDGHLRGIVLSGLRWECGRRVTNAGMALGIDYVRWARSLERLSDANANGKSVYVLRLEMKAENNSYLTQRVWIGKLDYIVYKSESVAVGPAPEAKLLRMGNHKRTIMTVSITTRLLRRKVNSPISDAAFRFIPPAGARPFAPPPMPPLGARHHH